MSEEKMSNKSEGNKFEQELCEILSKEGFWCHNFANRAEGQPADVIAVRRDYAVLIDCKDCKGDSFRLSRIEDNQWTAMQMWEIRTDYDAWFAIKIHGSIYMIPFKYLITIREELGYKSIDVDDLNIWGSEVSKWVSSLLHQS